MLKLLVVNPNTSTAATESIRKEAERASSPTTQIVAATVPIGPQNISSSDESRMQGQVVLDVIRRHVGAIDGAITAAYSDPGLALARMKLAIPVLGIGESSMKEAVRLGDRVVIVSPTPINEPLYRACAQRAGVEGKIANIRFLDKQGREPLAAFSDRHWLMESVASACHRAAEEDRADAIIVAGGPLAGIAREINQLVSIPILDCIACAVVRAERRLSTGFPD